ncbi:MAG: response regulator [Candidatus Latescibacteria bacterium]|nr:response regulator [Candidatus Latescibacterota bacterium]NIO55291.1 response regulator [Candidatus Latescibacterota bacterium]
MRILVVEDEKKVASFIKKGLEEESYAVDVAANGSDAEFLAQMNPYDLIVLDLMLPGKDGVDVCRALRARKVRTPILMLTARDSLEDKVEGLDSGADDYLTKPFAFEELLARVRALLRRGPTDDASPLRVEDLILDRSMRKARRGDREIFLTNREFALLEFFMHRVRRVLSRAVIAEHVWGHDFDAESNVIDVTISHLRSKVDRDTSCPLIHTVRGVGYIMCKKEDL